MHQLVQLLAIQDVQHLAIQDVQLQLHVLQLVPLLTVLATK